MYLSQQPPPLPQLVDDKHVRVFAGAPFPNMCVKCGGSDASLRMEMKEYSWFPSWTYVFLFFGILPGAVVQAAFTKKVQLVHPLCAACNQRWKAAKVAWTLSVITPVMLGIGVMMYGASKAKSSIIIVGLVILVAGMLIGPILVKVLMLNPRLLHAVQIDEQNCVTLKGFAPQVLNVFANK